jgi:DNA processing protein
MDVLYEVALSRLKGMGGATARQLIGRHQSAEAFFSLGPAAIRKLYPRLDFPSTDASLKRFMEQTQRFINQQQVNDVEVVTWKHHLYPARLKHIPDAPLVLFCKGNTYPRHEKVISIVGTRRASGYGIDQVKELIKALKPWNPVIISGLAYGIDGQAHKSALANNLPTLAIMANGMDKVYPSAHRSLATEIAGSGGLVTEYPLGTNPEIYQFPERNRIIAGLSDLTVVVEAREKGGALITADLANDYNREVAAIPGDVTRQASRG